MFRGPRREAGTYTLLSDEVNTDHSLSRLQELGPNQKIRAAERFSAKAVCVLRCAVFRRMLSSTKDTRERGVFFTDEERVGNDLSTDPAQKVEVFANDLSADPAQKVEVFQKGNKQRFAVVCFTTITASIRVRAAGAAPASTSSPSGWRGARHRRVRLWLPLLSSHQTNSYTSGHLVRSASKTCFPVLRVVKLLYK